MQNFNIFEKELYRLALKAYKKGEVPVAALIVHDNKIIAKSYNKRKRTNNPLYHAEVSAILKATKKIGDWRLSDCDLYVTLEPCHMCKEIIKESRIKKVYYYMDNNKSINFKVDFIKMQNKVNNKYEQLLTTFFKNLR